MGPGARASAVKRPAYRRGPLTPSLLPALQAPFFGWPKLHGDHKPRLRHCEERSDAAVHAFEIHGLLHFVRNDGNVVRTDGTVVRNDGEVTRNDAEVVRNDGDGSWRQPRGLPTRAVAVCRTLPASDWVGSHKLPPGISQVLRVAPGPWLGWRRSRPCVCVLAPARWRGLWLRRLHC